MLRDYPNELEADLLQIFGVDLLDYWRRRLSLRRLSVLTLRLLSMPGRSALAEAYFGDRARWDETRYMLADIIDCLRLGNWMTVQVHKAEGADNPMPEPYPRPGVAKVAEEPQEPKRKFAAPHEVADLLSRLSSG